MSERAATSRVKNPAFLLILAMLAFLIVVNILTLQARTRSQKSAAAIVRVSGRQRVLSQRMALLAQNLLRAETSDERAVIRKELAGAIALFKRSHRGLSEGDPEMGLPGDLPPEARVIYFEPPVLLDEHVHPYLKSLKLLNETPDAQLTSDDPSVQTIWATATQKTLLDGLDAAVTAFQNDGEAKVASLERRIWWVFGGTLLAVATAFWLAFLIFKRTGALEVQTRTLSRSKVDLERANASLAEIATRLALPPRQDMERKTICLPDFCLDSMMACGGAIRRTSMLYDDKDDFAREIVRYFHEQFVDQQGGKAFALVRFFETRRYEELDGELQGIVTRACRAPSPGMQCLKLLATAGDRAEWNDTKQSVQHRAIPLPSEEAVERLPMIAQLIRQLGFEVGGVLKPDLSVLIEPSQTGVFHIAQAKGSSHIPAQESFVVPYGIRSVLGFGDALPDGSLFAIICFSKLPISRDIAVLFGHLSLSTRMALLSLSDVPRRTEAQLLSLDRLLRNHECIVSDQEKRLHATLEEVEKARQKAEQAERNARTSEAELRAILENMAEGVNLIQASNGIIVYTNPRFDEIFGYEPGELIFEHVTVLNAFGDKSPEETAAEIIRSLEEQGRWNGEVHNVRKDGTSFWTRSDVSTFEHAQYGTVWISVQSDVTERKHAAMELRESEERFKTLVEHAPEAVVLFDADLGRFVDANENALRLFATSRDELFTRHPAAFNSPTQSDSRLSIDCAQERIDQALEGRKPVFNWVLRNSRGVNIPCEVRLVRLPAANRRLVRASLTDITERIRAEEMLQESEERYRSLVESTSDWIWAVDQNGVYTYSSPKVKDLLGYEPEEVVGKTPYDFMPPDEAKRVAALVRRSFEARLPLVRLENMSLRKDGRQVVLETSGVPILSEDGELLGYRGIDRDITEFRQVEDSLKEREQRYRRLLAAITNYTYSVYFRDGVPVANEHGEGCLSVTGYSAEDFASDRYLWIFMVLSDDREMVRRHVAKVIAREEMPPFEHRILRKDGRVRWVRDTIVRHCDENGQIVRYDGVVEDITERKQAEDELWQKEAQLLAAQKIQERLLPQAALVLPGFDIAGAVYPAEFAAGDYFDYLAMPDGCTGFVIGDVSGHGFAPALIMASTHVLRRSYATLIPLTPVRSNWILATRLSCSPTESTRQYRLLGRCLERNVRSKWSVQSGTHLPGTSSKVSAVQPATSPTPRHQATTSLSS